MKTILTLAFAILMGPGAFANCISLEQARALVPKANGYMDEYYKFCQRPKIPGVGCRCQSLLEEPQIEAIQGGYKAQRCIVGYDEYNKLRGYAISCNGDVTTYEEIQ
jgi:hypothetical protein